MELRVLLEARAVEMAAQNVSSAVLAKLEKQHRAMEDLLARDRFDLRAYLKHNHRFHFAIYEMAGNVELMNMIETTWLRYGPMLNLLRERAALGDGNADHLEMVDGLRAGDGRRAVEGLRSDLQRAAAAIADGMTRTPRAAQ